MPTKRPTSKKKTTTSAASGAKRTAAPKNQAAPNQAIPDAPRAGDGGVTGTTPSEVGQTIAEAMASLWDPQQWLKPWGLGATPEAGTGADGDGDGDGAAASRMASMFDPRRWMKLISSGAISGAMPNPMAGMMPGMVPGMMAGMMPGVSLPPFGKAFDPSGWMKPWLSMAPGLSGQPGQPGLLGPPGADTLSNWANVMQSFAGADVQRLTHDAREYWIDFGQRCVLYMDTLRQRGNNMLDHYQAGMPPLLAHEHELVLDARDFDRPCNYQLLKIRHPEGKPPAAGRRPMVIIDPRAGHGPGIGGFKLDSEVGMGLTEGHPVYFVSFTPEPCPGQTIEDVEQAEVRFIEEVNRLHPDRELPLVYGNCQAGWAVAMLGADRPDVTGPIVINGAPMSYWAGGAGINPMRLAGGLTGGAWATRFLCDLGGGIFDGSHLVSNFENLNPANTLWAKEYRLFSHVDTEPPRYLEFERWWTGFFLMNEAEILWIVNNLFVGDKLEQGKLSLGPNHAIDMTKMDDPLVIFASSGDNITPPHQALHWISELYPTTDALKAAGQRIVYMVNPHIGHLGIFVSAKIARREHRAIIEHIESIRALSPGLYEMIIERETGETDPLKDQFVVKFAERRIKSVRFPVEQGAFERMVAVSRANEALYLQIGRPWMKLLMSGVNPEALRWLSPMRVSRYKYSDRVNPFMKTFELWAGQVKANRQAADESNSFRYAERRMSDNIVALLDAYRDVRDSTAELAFDILYSEDRTP